MLGNAVLIICGMIAGMVTVLAFLNWLVCRKCC